MNVLHINSNYSFTPLHSELIDKLNQFDMVNFVFMAHNGENESVIDVTRQSNIYSVKSFNKIDRYLYFLKQNKIERESKKHINLNEIDIIHAHTLFTDGYLAYKIYKKYKIPYVVSVRNTDVNSFFKKRILLRNLGIEILKNADKIIFLSYPYLQQVIQKYTKNSTRNSLLEKSIVIPNGINDEWHHAVVKSKKRHKNLIKLIYVGRVNLNKNLLTTIKSCELLIEQGYKVEYRVIGDSEDSDIQTILEKKSFVNYSSRMMRKQLINEYKEYDIFVMPSVYESFGLVYAEAMSQGLPIIYTKSQGFDGHFDDGKVGYAVSTFDETEIANKVLKIWGNYEYYSKNSILGTNRFKWEAIAAKYYDIYLKIYKKSIKE